MALFLGACFVRSDSCESGPAHIGWQQLSVSIRNTLCCVRQSFLEGMPRAQERKRPAPAMEDGHHGVMAARPRAQRGPGSPSLHCHLHRRIICISQLLIEMHTYGLGCKPNSPSKQTRSESIAIIWLAVISSTTTTISWQGRLHDENKLCKDKECTDPALEIDTKEEAASPALGARFLCSSRRRRSALSRNCCCSLLFRRPLASSSAFSPTKSTTPQ
jgi:hypothetical protein